MSRRPIPRPRSRASPAESVRVGVRGARPNARLAIRSGNVRVAMPRVVGAVADLGRLSARRSPTTMAPRSTERRSSTSSRRSARLTVVYHELPVNRRTEDHRRHSSACGGFVRGTSIAGGVGRGGIGGSAGSGTARCDEYGGDLYDIITRMARRDGIRSRRDATTTTSSAEKMRRHARGSTRTTRDVERAKYRTTANADVDEAQADARGVRTSKFRKRGVGLPISRGRSVASETSVGASSASFLGFRAHSARSNSRRTARVFLLTLDRRGAARSVLSRRAREARAASGLASGSLSLRGHVPRVRALPSDGRVRPRAS